MKTKTQVFPIYKGGYPVHITLASLPYDISSPTVGAIRIRAAGAAYSGLDRYHITQTAQETKLPAYECSERTLTLKSESGEVLTTLSITQAANGWQVDLSLRDGEKLYGLGDIDRTRLDRRGYRYRVWVINVKSYIPIPFLMSDAGWAIGINTTFEHFFDVGATFSDTLSVRSPYGIPDITLYTGKDFKELLYRYTSVSGRPLMLPRWAMGLTFVCNTKANDSELVSDGLNFRREDMPCDILGLEPGWMEKNYDYSIKKNWHPERFYIPSYAAYGPHTFLGAIKRIGYKLSLWLCIDYDLTWYEEQLIAEESTAKGNIDQPDDSGSGAISFELDEHFTNSDRKMDTLTNPKEPWFEHLKKFVDQGVSAFKLDGSNQVLDHSDRLYGNGMVDKEVHNLYPIIYAKQMSLGYSEHTGKRAMIYTAAGYTGIQKYAATWAGDTGGGFGSLVSLMNNGMCGHSNTSCDMDVFSTEGMHYGFLQPWSQLNSWNYWRHPWLLEDENKEIFRYYDKLRYSLVPYFYTAAYQAYTTGMPVLRALPLVYPKDENVYERLSEYMLGDSFLVGVFLDEDIRTDENGRKTNFYLPEGEWYDFFTGEKYEGGQSIFYIPPKGKGGALFVKSGSAIPFAAEIRKCVGEMPFDKYIIRTWGENASGVIYDDDGISFGYQNGEYTLTSLTVENGVLTTSTEGSYPGMPDAEYILGEIIK